MVTEVTHESWFSRIVGSIKGIVIGGLLFLVSFPLLFWNEGRAVRTAKGLKEGAGAVVRVDSDAPDASHEGQFVHVSGEAHSSEQLTDDAFAINFEGIRLERNVEMYQWDEDADRKTKKKLGGGTTTTTTYSYEKVWSDHLIDSADFKESGHNNPPQMPFQNHVAQAKDVVLGGFRLSRSLVNQINLSEPLSFTKEALPEEIRNHSVLRNDGPNGSPRLYWSANQKHGRLSVDESVAANPNDQFEKTEFEKAEDVQSGAVDVASQDDNLASDAPAIGDVRIWFSKTPNTEVSVMAKQFGETFEPYTTQAGTELNMLTLGVVSPEAMIARAEADNANLTWILRGVGVIMMFFGVVMGMKPLAVLGDVIPLFGSIVAFGTTIVAAGVAISLSLVTIATAWIVYRPLLGIGLIAVAIAIIAFLVTRAKRKPEVLAPGVFEVVE
ncbi:TMEM43 family protein [Novipirellula sp. SH528]|uniref:TMEM43 family protein n=1 Tax=Novipirellula sp. SH528 TaxID=3454466 RepID=UPI003FA0DC94